MGRPRSDIEPRILQAARARFLSHGVDGASLRAIADDADTSVGMIHYYFPSKDDLFLAVVEQVYIRLLEHLEAELAPERPVLDRVRAVYRRIGAVSEDEREIVRLVVREALTSATRLDRLIARFQRGHLPLLFGLVKDGLTQGVFDRSLHPALVAATMMAIGGPGQLILSAAGERLPFANAPKGDALADALVDLVMNGLAPRTRRAAPAPKRKRPARRR